MNYRAERLRKYAKSDTDNRHDPELGTCYCMRAVCELRAAEDIERLQAVVAEVREAIKLTLNTGSIKALRAALTTITAAEAAKEQDDA